MIHHVTALVEGERRKGERAHAVGMALTLKIRIVHSTIVHLHRKTPEGGHIDGRMSLRVEVFST